MSAITKQPQKARAAWATRGPAAAQWSWLCCLLVACGGGSADSHASSAGEASQAQSNTQPVASGGAGTTTTTTNGAVPNTSATANAPAASTKPPAAATPASGAMPQAGIGAAASVGSAGTGATAGAGATIDAAGGNAAGVSGAMATTTAEPEAPCPTTSSLDAGDNRKTLNHGGRDRRYNVYVPSNLPAMTRVPLVLDFHGNGSSGMQEESGSGWRQKADSEGFVVVYPDGVGNGWNVGNCCGEALNSMVDDVGFARAMVESVSAEACIDAHRVYATGISNGAGLAHRLACEAADVFAAIAAASADLVTDPCEPARPISEISVRGLNDTLVNYDGGNTGSTGWYSPGAKGTLALWKDIDGCTGDANMSMEYCESYTQCEAGVEVTLCSLPGTGHILYNNSLGFSVPDTAWEMFKRQTLP